MLMIVAGIDRGSTFLGVFGSGPWRQAPWLLLRRPLVLVAIAGAAMILSTAAASGVLFASTLGTASVQTQAAVDCPEGSTPEMRVNSAPRRVSATNQAADRALSSVDPTVAPYSVDLDGADIDGLQVTLLARQGSLKHVRLLTPNRGQPGGWFPRTYASALHVRPGQSVATSNGTIRVAGIYQDLAPNPFLVTPLPRYWCSWAGLILQQIGDVSTPPLVLADSATIASAGRDAEANVAVYAFLPVPVQSSSIGALARIDAKVPSAYRHLVRDVRYRETTSTGLLTQVGQDDPLGDKIAIADKVHDGLVGSVVPVAAGATLVALVLVAGAGGFWTVSRAREIRLLVSRGIAPPLIGVKAVLETAPATVVGGVVGVVVARLMVAAIGPARQVAPGADVTAALTAATSLAAGLLVIFVLATASARKREAPIGRRARAGAATLRVVPWELAPLGAAVWLAHSIGATSGVTVENSVVTVKAELLVFPLLGATGALLLLARVVRATAPLLGRSAPRLGRAGYLALRRISRSPSVAVGLLVGAALPIALLTYAGMVSYGTQHEVTEKYRTNIGAELVLDLIGVHETTPRLNSAGTAVVAYVASDARLSNGTPASVLGVDPSTFADFAFVSKTQRGDVTRLADGPTGAAILVNAPAGEAPTAVRIGRSLLTIDPVARADVFPGLRNGAFPMVVVDRSLLDHVDTDVTRTNQAWTTDADAERANQAIGRAGDTVLDELTPQVLIDNTGLLPITWIFGYLRALAYLIGAVALAGLVFALAARARERTVAYVLSRRMGMSQPTHLRSLLIELGGVVGAGWAAGAAAGAIGFAAIVSALNVYPSVPPGATFALPATVFVSSAIAALGFTVVAALVAHRFAERADPSSVLRLE